MAARIPAARCFPLGCNHVLILTAPRGPAGCEYLINVLLLLTGVFVNMIHGRIVTSAELCSACSISRAESASWQLNTPVLVGPSTPCAPAGFGSSKGSRPGHSPPSLPWNPGWKSEATLHVGFGPQFINGSLRRPAPRPGSRGLTQASYSREQGTTPWEGLSPP